MGLSSIHVRDRIVKLCKQFPQLRCKVVLKPTHRLSDLFPFKDRLPASLKSSVVYKFQCGGCKSIYYGKSIRHLHTRVCEHAGVSQLTGKVSKSPAPGAVFDHFLSCPVNVRVVDGLPVFPTTVRPKMCDFSVLCSASTDFQLKIKESFLISRDRPPLNRNISSLPLLLF